MAVTPAQAKAAKAKAAKLKADKAKKAKLAKDAATKAAVNSAAAMGVSAAFMEATPELKNVYTAYKAKDYTKAETLFKQTNFYKSVPLKERAVQKVEQNDIYLKQLEAYTIASQKRLALQGIHLDSKTLKDYAERSYDLGFSDDQFDKMIIDNSKTGKIGGGISGNVSQLQGYANSFGVGKYFNSDYWGSKSKDLFAGSITVDDIQNDIRQHAASAFPGYAEQINNGVSLDALTSAYKASIANILEIPPNSITYDNKYLKQAMQAVGPDGKPIVKPIWQFEKELRSAPEWANTNNGRDTIDSLSLKVLRDWGLA